ncbi:hypothetical protein ACJX0J_022478, partial [Zea mays]
NVSENIATLNSTSANLWEFGGIGVIALVVYHFGVALVSSIRDLLRQKKLDIIEIRPQGLRDTFSLWEGGWGGGGWGHKIIIRTYALLMFLDEGQGFSKYGLRDILLLTDEGHFRLKLIKYCRKLEAVEIGTIHMNPSTNMRSRSMSVIRKGKGEKKEKKGKRKQSKPDELRTLSLLRNLKALKKVNLQGFYLQKCMLGGDKFKNIVVSPLVLNFGLTQPIWGAGKNTKLCELLEFAIAGGYGSDSILFGGSIFELKVEKFEGLIKEKDTAILSLKTNKIDEQGKHIQDLGDEIENEQANQDHSSTWLLISMWII